MDILLVNVEVSYETRQRYDVTSFEHPMSFLGYDVVVIDLNEATELYMSGSTTENDYQVLAEEESARYIDDYNRRATEIRELLRIGAAIVVFATGSQTIMAQRKSARPDKKRSKRPMSFVNTLGADIDFQPSVGHQVESREPGAFATFAQQSPLRYDGYVSEGMDSAFCGLFIRGTERCVGLAKNVDKGLAIVAPLASSKEHESAYYSGLLALVSELRARRLAAPSVANVVKTVAAPPEWVYDVALPGERALRERLQEIVDAIAALRRDETEVSSKLAEFDRLKALMYATGNDLEDAVREVLEKLGAPVAVGAEGRDDLIIRWKDRVGHIEIKGVTGSAAERHAAQLEKWVSNGVLAGEQNPKGILIVNPFRSLPYNERLEDPFPTQMLDYSRARKHCLMTSTELLALFGSVLANEQTNDNVLSVLFNSVGRPTPPIDVSRYIS